jgi:NAD(P)-dependent dehydrogenase (short-subunit alcohol dehydrogenase family)
MKKGSSVIFNTSVATEIAMHNFSIYSAAKSAVQSFIKTFAVELTDRGIRVNGVSPGHIKTNIFNNTGLVQNRLKVQLMTLFLPYLSKDKENLRKLPMCSLASDEALYSWCRDQGRCRNFCNKIMVNYLTSLICLIILVLFSTPIL